MRGRRMMRIWALSAAAGFGGKALACSYGPDAKAAAVYSYAGRELAKEKGMDWVVAELGGVENPAEFAAALAVLTASPLVEGGTLQASYQERFVGFVLKRKDPAAFSELARDLYGR